MRNLKAYLNPENLVSVGLMKMKAEASEGVYVFHLTKTEALFTNALTCKPPYAYSSKYCYYSKLSILVVYLVKFLN